MNQISAVKAMLELCGPADPHQLAAALYATGFSADVYRRAHKDLLAKCPDADSALTHFFRHGVPERRRFPIDLAAGPVRILHQLPVARPEYVMSLLAALTNAYTGTVHDPFDETVPQRLAVLTELRCIGCRPFLLVGDSHSNLYRRSSVRATEWLTPIHVLCSAGSAQGLVNPASLSGYGDRIRRLIARLEDIPEAASLPIMLQFGQVDAEFVYTFRRVRDHRDIFHMDDWETFCCRSVDSYISFLCEVFHDSRRSDVVILSIFPPSLSDEKWAEGYINGHILSLEGPGNAEVMSRAIRQIEMPNLKTRTAMHAYYNTQLRAACVRHGFHFADGFSPFLGPGAVLAPSFVPTTKGLDHHLEFHPTAHPTQAILWQFIDIRGQI